MISRKFPAAPAVLLALALLLAALPALAQPLAVTDCAGRELSIPAPVERIICLGPGCLRLIVYLGAQDKVVGVEELEKRFPDGRPYYMANPWLGDLPFIGPGGVPAIGNLPDIEAVLKARPQVIFAIYLPPEKARRLQEITGVPVVILEYGPFASFDGPTLFHSLRVAGRVLGHEARAEEVIAYVQGRIDDLGRRASGPPPATAYVGGIGFKGTQGLESSDCRYVPFDWLGVKNAAPCQGPRGHTMVGRERLLAINPPTIFLDVAGEALVRADMAKRPGYYEALAAVRDGRVFILHPFNWYTTNLGTALADAYAIGKALYPAAFGDVDIPAAADDIYTHLVGKPVYGAMEKLYGPLGAKAKLAPAPEKRP